MNCYLFSYSFVNNKTKNSGFGDVRFSLKYMDETTFEECRKWLEKEHPDQSFSILNVVNLGEAKVGNND